MAVTIRDVAKEAGVSPATVSRVFNHSDLVTDETQNRVMQVARQMGYQPNATAKSLSHGRTNAIGILLPAPHGEFFSEVIRGIDEVAQASEHYLLISSSHYSLSESEAAFRALRGRVDGLLVMTTHVRAETMLQSVSLDVPTVFMNSALSGTQYDTFDIENRRGAQAVVAHLADRGAASIGVIEGPTASFDTQERLAGYRQALEKAGIDPTAQVRIEGDFTQASGYEAGQKLLELDALPDAVFSCNDYMAIGVMAALQEAGVHIPGDLLIAGFDDIPSARYFSPSLTTVRVPAYDLGHRAAEHLLRRMNHQAAPDTAGRVLPSELVVRSSTGGNREE
jgi:LacI family transcriptional regulator